MSVTVLVNGHLAETDTCSTGNEELGGPVVMGSSPWKSLGVRLGKPSTVTLRFSEPPRNAAGSFAVYQAVPRAQFVFPPRPKVLHLPSVAPKRVLASAAKGGANGRFTITATPGETLKLVTAAPGTLSIGCGNKDVTGIQSWYYGSDSVEVSVTPTGLGPACVGALKGKAVRLTVEASQFEAPGWYVCDDSDGD